MRRMVRSRPRLITPALLDRWPLPVADGGGKESRGRVLIVGGAAAMPGAIVLSARAALRAGAGKLQIATAKSVRSLVAAAMPEACVFALPEARDGAITAGAAGAIVERAATSDAVLIGPGMMGNVVALMRSVARKLKDATVLLDAEAMMFLADDPTAMHHLRERLVLTPHAGEFASLRGVDKEEAIADAPRLAQAAAAELRGVVALKGAETFIAAPDGETYVNRAGNAGLGTSGSGDVLAGIIVGLLARGCTPLVATAWGVHLHARAGDRLARRIGPLGYLARELPDEIPALMKRPARRS
jgi:ADP-dependent NAD(P)H-hydrate dehydratase